MVQNDTQAVVFCASLPAVNGQLLVPIDLLLAEHKHYVVIVEQSEVIQVNTDVKTERLPKPAVSVRVTE